MEQAKGPNLWRPNVASRCKSCGPGGGGGGPETFQAMLLIIMLLFPPLSYAGYRWFSASGVRIEDRACAWDGDRQRYRATVTLQNNQPIMKVVSLKIQGHFRPPTGRQWPSNRHKAHYADVSKASSVILEPRGSALAAVEFTLPGVEAFDCRADVSIVGQEKFRDKSG